jgi:hypothetical protein
VFRSDQDAVSPVSIRPPNSPEPATLPSAVVPLMERSPRISHPRIEAEFRKLQTALRDESARQNKKP